MYSTSYITRNQLKGYGATVYQARVITQNLQPVTKSNCSNIYALPEVILFVKEYLKKTKISQKTRQSLSTLLPRLLNQFNNVVPAIFEKSVNRELEELTKSLFIKSSKLDRKLIDSQVRLATIKGKQVK